MGRFRTAVNPSLSEGVLLCVEFSLGPCLRVIWGIASNQQSAGSPLCRAPVFGRFLAHSCSFVRCMRIVQNANLTCMYSCLDIYRRCPVGPEWDAAQVIEILPPVTQKRTPRRESTRSGGCFDRFCKSQHAKFPAV